MKLGSASGSLEKEQLLTFLMSQTAGNHNSVKASLTAPH